MKKLIFTFLPLVAAVLFATSCSKDDNDNNEVAQDKTVSVTFTANVGESSGLSKITVARGKDKDGNEKGFAFTWEGNETINVFGPGNPTVKETTLDKENNKLTIVVEGLHANWTSVYFAVGDNDPNLTLQSPVFYVGSIADLGRVQRTATVTKDNIAADFTFDFPYAVVYNSSATNAHNLLYKTENATRYINIEPGKVCLVVAGVLIGKSMSDITTVTEAGKSYVLKD